MKNPRLLLVVLLFTAKGLLFAQNPLSGGGYLTPAGLLDTLLDRFGNKYTLNDLRIGSDFIPQGSEGAKSNASCSSGYFDLTFETGSGMEGSTQIEIDRRAVVCQVFQDISAFINSPLSVNGGKVNIWVRDFSSIIPNSSTSGIAGLATSFYSVPNNSTAGFGGIADNQMWVTIRSGTDSYTNVGSPLITTGSNTSFYHGMVAINFNNPTVNWHTNLGSVPAVGLSDLYSTVLHEVSHALGLASLINHNGLSQLGNGYNYYSRYDLFLKNHTNTQNLITNSGACSLYNYQFNPALNVSVLTPGCGSFPPVFPGSSDFTDCNTALNYSGGTNIPLYTPACFETGSSLSHLEDICYPGAGSPYGNDLYFVMSNAGGTGPLYTKRHLTEEERLVLCDLGYNTNPNFGNSINLNNYSYVNPSCTGNDVTGINDGFTGSGGFSFSGSAGANISITGILSNDYVLSPNTLGFECLQDIFDPAATLSVTSGGAATTITFNSAVGGVHLLRYIPVSSSGKRGNITYVYAYVFPTNCTPAASACNMVNNGGFEVATGCANSTNFVSCWTDLSGTPDILTRFNCSPFQNIKVGANTWYSNPPSDTHNGAPNNNFVSMLATKRPSYSLREASQTILNTPLIPNQSYVLSFWAKVDLFSQPNPFNSNFTFPYASLNFTSLSGIVAPVSLYSPFPVYFPGSVGLVPTVQVPNDNTWHLFSIPFTYSGTSNHNVLAMWSEIYPDPANQDGLIFIDDVSILPQQASLSLPATLCLNQNLPDLSQYLSPAPAGGTFSGPGVINTGGVFSFDPAIAGVGSHTIIYSFTNGAGCITSTSGVINVVNSNLTITANATPGAVCQGFPTTLSATGASTYNWQPGNLSGSSVIANPPATTIYTVTGTDASGCSATASATVTVHPPVTITASSTVICAGQRIFLTIGGAVFFGVHDNFGIVYISVANPISVNPSVTTTYIVDGTDAFGCQTQASVTVVVKPLPIVFPTPPFAIICKGQSVTLSAIGNATSYFWPGVGPGTSITVAPSLSTVYNVVGTLNGCSSAQIPVPVTVNQPTVDFTINPNPTCVNHIINFTSTITCVSPVTSILWKFGDGATSSLANPTHTYTVGGSYTVSLIVNGATIVNKPLTIIPGPIITNILSNSGGFSSCITDTYSANVQPGPNAYSWTASGGTIAGSATSPSVTVNWAGAGTLTLTLTDQSTGCQSTQTINIDACCKTATPNANNINILSGGNWSTLGLGSSLASKNLYVNGTLIIDQTVVWSNCNVVLNSGAKIIVQTGALFRLLNGTDLYACNSMWQGITIQQGGDLRVNASFIQDAEAAITSVDGGSYFVRNGAKLIKNFKGIVVQTYGGVHPGIIQESFIHSNPNGSGGTIHTYPGVGDVRNLRSPHANQRADLGIEIEDVFNITIGQIGASSLQNTFDNLNGGIKSSRTNLNVYNNIFTNISTPANPGTNGNLSAIWAQGMPGQVFVTVYSLVVGDNTTQGLNSFNNCRAGVFAEKNLNVSIRKNDYSNGPNRSVAFHVTRSNAGNTIVIRNNTIQQANIGIACTDNKVMSTTIANNVISNLLSNASSSATGILAQETFVNNPQSHYFINNNIITGAKTGIVANGLNAPEIKLNGNSATPIQMQSGAGTIGISITNCNNALVTQNRVLGVTGALGNKSDKGIYCSMSPNTTLCNNIVRRLNIGIECAGSNMFPSTVYNNTFAQNQFGFELSNSGVIGPQGNSTVISSHNSFASNNVFATRANVSNGTGSPFYSALPLPITNTIVPPATQVQFFTSTGSQSGCGNPPPPCPFPPCTTPLAAMRQQIAQGADTYPALQPNSRWHAKHALYISMMQDSSIWVGDTILTNFKNNTALTTLALLDSIKAVLINPDSDTLALQQASVLNASLTETDHIEHCSKKVNEIMLLARLQNERLLTPAEQDSVRAIAMLCPFKDGKAVYEARAIITLYDTTVVTYIDDCISSAEDPASRQSYKMNTYKEENKGDVESDENSFVIYPNPNVGEMEVTFHLKTTDKASFLIYDLEGREVYSGSLRNDERVLHISQKELSNGVYFYKIIATTGGELQAGKIIIIK